MHLFCFCFFGTLLPAVRCCTAVFPLLPSTSHGQSSSFHNNAFLYSTSIIIYDGAIHLGANISEELLAGSGGLICLSALWMIRASAKFLCCIDCLVDREHMAALQHNIIAKPAGAGPPPPDGCIPPFCCCRFPQMD